MIKYLKKLYLTMGNGMNRYLVTILFLLVLTVINFRSIEDTYNTSTGTWIISLVIGVFLSTTLQMIYERFFQRPMVRFVFYGVAVAGVAVSYLLLKDATSNLPLSIRIGIILFILFVAFLWVPTIKSKVSLPESIFATFKAGLLAGVYASTLFVGVCIILAAINGLITNLDGEAYLHAANVIYVLFMPISFLSFIPIYDGWESEEEQEKINLSNRFFDTLIAYILIPITIVFTGVLLIYIGTNISSDFWSENLLEAILLVYAIVVIVIYLLSCCIDKPITKYFRLIFPYVLVVMVVIQTIASILKAMEIGITYGRYYSIMFGAFAFLSGMIFILRKYFKINWVAPILILLALISIVPPVDAFSRSRSSQIKRLETVLKKNDMLKEGQLHPSSDISEDDQEIIINAYRELSNMDAFQSVAWLESYDGTESFEHIFGFAEYEWNDRDYIRHSYNVDQSALLSVEGYDFIYDGQLYDSLRKELIKDDKTYILECIPSDGEYDELRIRDEAGNVIIRMDLKEIYDRMKTFPSDISEISQEDGTFIVENEDMQMKVLLYYFNMSVEIDSSEATDGVDGYQLMDMMMEANVLIDFK